MNAKKTSSRILAGVPTFHPAEVRASVENIIEKIETEMEGQKDWWNADHQSMYSQIIAYCQRQMFS